MPFSAAGQTFVLNQRLIHHYEGLTADGGTYVVATLPLSIAILANDPNPAAAVPAGGVPYPVLGVHVSHSMYFAAVTAALNAAAGSAFSPTLDALDNLIGNIQVTS